MARRKRGQHRDNFSTVMTAIDLENTGMTAVYSIFWAMQFIHHLLLNLISKHTAITQFPSSCAK